MTPELLCELCRRPVHPMKATRWGRDVPPEYLCPECLPFARQLFYWPLAAAMVAVFVLVWFVVACNALGLRFDWAPLWLLVVGAGGGIFGIHGFARHVVSRYCRPYGRYVKGDDR